MLSRQKRESNISGNRILHHCFATKVNVFQPGAMDKEYEQFVRTLQRLVTDIDTSFTSYSVPQCRASSAVAAIRDCLSQLAMSPRDPVQLCSMTQRLIEQMLAAYRNPDNPQCSMC